MNLAPVEAARNIKNAAANDQIEIDELCDLDSFVTDPCYSAVQYFSRVDPGSIA